jgi:hypothetical protein
LRLIEYSSCFADCRIFVYCKVHEL